MSIRWQPMSEIRAVEGVHGTRTVDRAPGARLVLVSTLSSDAHTWNLVFLQLLLEERGCSVINLGGCVPEDELVAAVAEHRPQALVISSVNGHGFRDGRSAIRRLRDDPSTVDVPAVIGGKLGIDGPDGVRAAQLIAAGFDVVLDDGPAALARLHEFIDALPVRQVGRVG
jgi:methylaspartate mutase sigma subunit